MPSTLGVESLQRVFAPIARPDVPAAGGQRYVIIRGGYPRLDQNIAYFKEHAATEKTIIYAPTVPLPEFEPYVSVPRWAEAIVETLLDRFPDYRVIFRPHPHSLERVEVQALIKRFTPHPRYETDLRGSDYMPTYSRAALMVSDTSGTAYTYAFTTGRPVIFFSPNDAEAKTRNPGVRYFEFRESVGLVAQDTDSLAAALKTALADPARFRSSSWGLRDRVVFNVGGASEYLVSVFDHLVRGTDIPGAIYFRAEPESGAPA
jgi:CDP-glycerol glycerophosphotransferase (TagB/SpsB family)